MRSTQQVRDRWQRREGTSPLVPFAFLLIALTVAVSPLAESKIWWYLAVGRSLVEEGTIPSAISAGSAPAPAVLLHEGWLSAVLLYLIYNLGGDLLLAVLRLILVLTAMGLIAIVAWRSSGGRPVSVILALVPATLLTSQAWSLGPHTFALPLVSALILVADSYLSRQRGPKVLIWLPLLALFWVNLDFGAVAAALIILALLFGIVWSSVRQDGFSPVRLSPKPLLLVALVTLMVLVANPINAKVFRVLTLSINQGVLAVVAWDWHAPRITGDLPGMFFFISLLLQIPLWRWLRRQPDRPQLLALLVLAWLSFRANHWIPLYGLVLAWLMASALPPLQAQLRDPLIPWRPGGALFGTLCAAGGILLWSLHQYQPIPASAATQAVPTVLPRPLSRLMVETLRSGQASDHGNLFYPLDQHGYLIWIMPEKQSVLNWRTELPRSQLWKDYVRISVVCDVDAVAERYHFRRVLVNKQSHSALVRALRNNDRWELRQEDEVSLLFVSEVD